MGGYLGRLGLKAEERQWVLVQLESLPLFLTTTVAFEVFLVKAPSVEHFPTLKGSDSHTFPLGHSLPFPKMALS